MNILSLTFHVEQNIITLWKDFMQQEVIKFAENTDQESKYILSKVANNYQEEGENYNIILVFNSEIDRNTFISEKLPMLNKTVQASFPNQEVIIFMTNLDVISQNF